VCSEAVRVEGMERYSLWRNCPSDEGGQGRLDVAQQVLEEDYEFVGVVRR